MHLHPWYAPTPSITLPFPRPGREWPLLGVIQLIHRKAKKKVYRHDDELFHNGHDDVNRYGSSNDVEQMVMQEDSTGRVYEAHEDKWQSEEKSDGYAAFFWRNTGRSRDGCGIDEDQANVGDDEEDDSDFASSLNLDFAVRLDISACTTYDVEDEADRNEYLKKTEMLDGEGGAGLGVDEVDTERYVNKRWSTGQIHTYNRDSTPRVARSNGERPIESMTAVAVITPEEWS